MNAKFSLALIALVGVGVFALPSTMALFSGQHSFYNIDATGNQIPCVKCHGDVKAELSSGSSDTTGTKGPHANFKCEYCHRTEAGAAQGDDAALRLGYDNADPAIGEADQIYLVTTIYNLETGNFPKVIKYTAGMTVDDFSSTNAFNFDLTGAGAGKEPEFKAGTAWVDRTEGPYPGKLSPFGTGGATYILKHKKELPLYNKATGQPFDTVDATKNTAFNPRAVTFDGTAGKVIFDNAGSREVTPGTRYHAASLVSCMECHGGDLAKGAPGYEIIDAEPYKHRDWLLDATDSNSKCSNCHYANDPGANFIQDDLNAGGFGLTGGPLGSLDTGTEEAHKNWVTTDDKLTRFQYGASNGACIACHTHVAVDINFKKGYKLQLSATENSGKYTVGPFAVEGTVDVSVYGNGDGSVFATDNKKITWTPTGDQLYINGIATKPVGSLSGEQTDNEAALLS